MDPRPERFGFATDTSAIPQVDLNNLPVMQAQPRSPLRNLLDDYIGWSKRRKDDIYYLTTLDVSVFTAFEADCRKNRRRPPSMVAYLVRCLGVAMAEDRGIMASALGRGLYVPEGVNVALVVSALTPSGDPIPLIMELTDVQRRGLDEIGDQIADNSRALRREGVRDSPALRQAAWLGRRSKLTRRAVYAFAALNPRFRRYLSYCVSFVGITSLTRYTGNRGGWGIPQLPYSFNLSLGSLSRKPLVVGEEILARDCLDVTVVLDHAIMDGAPALTIFNKWVEEVESGRLLAEFGAGAPREASE